MTSRTDDFNRTGTGSLGTPSDGGSAWVANAGVWEIDTNRAYMSNGANQATVVLESSTTDVDVQVTIAAADASGTDAGLVARASNSSNYIVGTVSGTSAGVGPRIFEVVGGSFNLLGTGTGGVVANDVVLLQVSGTTLTLKVNGTTKVTGTRTQSSLDANTKHGMRVHTENLTRFDDFSITDTGGVGGSAIGAITNIYRQRRA